MRNYTVGKIENLIRRDKEDFDKSSYVELRNLTCSRLTLFNARRGGEPARMKEKHWLERQKWLQKQTCCNAKATIVYAPGKGNHLVDCIVPKECAEAIDLLLDEGIRKQAGVAESNKYIFANTENSDTHCGGWNATSFVLEAAGISCPEMTATGMRIKISTLYAALDDKTSADRQLFYSHMGHTEEVNRGTYQRPLAEETLEKIGGVLLDMDRRSSEGQQKQNFLKPFIITAFIFMRYPLF